ncbi:MAG: hypothetical protein WC157_01415 [Candidatus Paceibacterota bacterium]
MFDITKYTNLILEGELHSFISPIKTAVIAISLVFIFISCLLLINEKSLLLEAKRRVLDFLYTYKHPKSFNKLFSKIEKDYKKENYKAMLFKIDNLMFQILKRFSYTGKDTLSIINDYKIEDKAIPNIENIKRVSELKNEKNLQKQEMKNIFNLTKDTLIKLNILKK